MRTPQSTVTSVPRSTMRSVGCACGSAPFSPEATIVSNESSSAPCACRSSRSRQAISRSLRPTNVSAVSASKPRSAIRAALAIFATSSAS
jgi:hypothetical protein